MDINGGFSPNPNQGNNPNQQPAPSVSAPPTAPTLEAPLSGASLDASVNPQQFTPQDQGVSSIQPVGAGVGVPKKSKGTLKKVLFILLALIVVSGLSGGAYFVGFAAGKTAGRTEADAEYQRKQAAAQQEQAEKEEETEEPVDEETAKAELQLGDLKQPKYEDETIEGVIGKQVSAGDGLVLKVVNIERNYQTTDQNYRPDTSKELIKVNFLVGNVANDKPKDISNFNFKVEDSSGALLTPENIADYPDKFDTLKVDQGAQAKASIVYKVNKGEVPLKFVREQRYRITTENREVTTRIVITLAK